MEVLLLLVMGIANIVCFVIGAKVGQAVSKGEDIKIPTVNPVKAFKEHEAKKEAQMEQNRIDTIMRNIEGYDGTWRGQEDVPGR
jgi:hypothetical protein